MPLILHTAFSRALEVPSSTHRSRWYICSVGLLQALVTQEEGHHPEACRPIASVSHKHAQMCIKDFKLKQIVPTFVLYILTNQQQKVQLRLADVCNDNLDFKLFRGLHLPDFQPLSQSPRDTVRLGSYYMCSLLKESTQVMIFMVKSMSEMFSSRFGIPFGVETSINLRKARPMLDWYINRLVNPLVWPQPA